METKLKKQTYLGVVIILLAFAIASLYYFKVSPNKNVLAVDQTIYDKIPTQAGKNNFMQQTANLTKPTDPELADLDSQIISCAPNVDSLLSSSPITGGSCAAGPTKLGSIQGLYMGGQCCSAMMDTVDRHANLIKLQAFKDTPNIPLDPMHTPVAMAKMWIDYDNANTLTATEQIVYDDAMGMSKEKPCCCKR